MLTGYKTFIVMALGLLAAWLQSKGIVFPESDQAAVATAIVSVAGIVMRLLTRSPPGRSSDTLPVLLLGAGLVALAACSPQAQQRVLAAAQVFCQVNGQLQPIVVALAPLAGQPTVTAAAVDTALVHPAVLAACAQLHGVPVGVSVAAAP